MTTEDYLKGFWPDLSEAHDLYDSLTSLVGVETNVGELSSLKYSACDALSIYICQKIHHLTCTAIM